MMAAGLPTAGFDGVLASTIPAAAGLSSSAALELASAWALSGPDGPGVEPLALARIAQRAENRYVGVDVRADGPVRLGGRGGRGGDPARLPVARSPGRAVAGGPRPRRRPHWDAPDPRHVRVQRPTGRLRPGRGGAGGGRAVGRLVARRRPADARAPRRSARPGRAAGGPSTSSTRTPGSSPRNARWRRATWPSSAGCSPPATRPCATGSRSAHPSSMRSSRSRSACPASWPRG